MQTYNFSILLLVKTNILKDDQYNRLLLPFTLNADLELCDITEDPLCHLTLTNIVLNPSLIADGTPRQGSHEILDVLYQVIIKMCSKPGQLVGDLPASTGASYRACKASGCHFFGLEADRRTYNALLKPLSSLAKDLPLLVNHWKAQPWHANRIGK